MKTARRRRPHRATKRAVGVARPRASGYPAGVVRRVSATEAARTFSDLLNRVQYRGERFVVERGSVAVCELGPVRPPSFRILDLVALLRGMPWPDPEYWDDLQRIGRQQAAVERSPWES